MLESSSQHNSYCVLSSALYGCVYSWMCRFVWSWAQIEMLPLVPSTHTHTAHAHNMCLRGYNTLAHTSRVGRVWHASGSLSLSRRCLSKVATVNWANGLRWRAGSRQSHAPHHIFTVYCCVRCSCSCELCVTRTRVPTLLSLSIILSLSFSRSIRMIALNCSI